MSAPKIYSMEIHPKLGMITPRSKPVTGRHWKKNDSEKPAKTLKKKISLPESQSNWMINWLFLSNQLKLKSEYSSEFLKSWKDLLCWYTCQLSCVHRIIIKLKNITLQGLRGSLMQNVTKLWSTNSSLRETEGHKTNNRFDHYTREQTPPKFSMSCLRLAPSKLLNFYQLWYWTQNNLTT